MAARLMDLRELCENTIALPSSLLTKEKATQDFTGADSLRVHSSILALPDSHHTQHAGCQNKGKRQSCAR